MLHSGGHDVASYAHGKLESSEEDVYLLEPLTFMNRSGEAIGPFVRRQAVPPSDVLVVCDEAQLPVGRLRLRAEGSAGGHHGLESVIAALGTEAFPRLRIGVGRQPLPEDLAGFVLGRWTTEEWARIETALPYVVDACGELAMGNVVAADNAITRSNNLIKENRG